MFIFEWAFGLLFWVAYISCGLVFCVVFMRSLTPLIFKRVIGAGKKNSWGSIYVDGKWVMNEEVFFVVFASLVLWPVTLVVTIFCFGFKLFCKAFMFCFSKAIIGVDAVIPEIKIEQKKKEKSDK